MKDQSIAKRLQEICSDYYETYMETPPIPVSSMERMNSLLGGTRKPTVEELLAISETYDVSINYLLTGDELFPSLHRIPKKDQKRLLAEIEDLKQKIES
jgi:hypothetical protein